ncbi:hypothetical protein [Paenibacillus harenae]|uniref:hypothetical protein n=1 Tax=Paenibacillus harenae TaxID=306543 RepID=UPI0003FDB8B0|nr:hypothetical protein [Paenibacillus harenae]
MAYIGLDRGIVDHWIYQDAEYFKVWFEMLYRARFSKEPHTELVDGEMVVVNYGEFIYGRIKWSERLKISEQRLRTLIKKLKAQDMIEVVSEHRKCTLYTIKNYAKFNQQSNQQEAQSDQGFEGNANQQSNQPSTSSQPAANQQPTTKEERKKDNNVKKVIKEHSQNTVELTNHLIALMQINNPNVKIPANLEKWRDEIEKLERIDKYDYMQIRSVIDWCQNDSFWKSNILSAPKLREKIGTLVMQMQRNNVTPIKKMSAFERLQQMSREESEREASGNY